MLWDIKRKGGASDGDKEVVPIRNLIQE